MLQNLREKFTGWVAITILAVIGVTFVFVGGANFTFTGNNYAAKVDDAEIGLNQFEAAYRDQLLQDPQLSQASDEMRLRVRTAILEQLIEQRVIDNYLEDAGYQISDAQIAATIQRAPEFQVDGRFDLETYRNLLAQNGYEPATFERAQRVTLRRDQLLRAMRGSALLTPSAYRRYLNLATEQRIVTLATIERRRGCGSRSKSPMRWWPRTTTTTRPCSSCPSRPISSTSKSNAAISRRRLPSAKMSWLSTTTSTRIATCRTSNARRDMFLCNSATMKMQPRRRPTNCWLALMRVRRLKTSPGIILKTAGTASRGGDLGTMTRTALPGDFGGTIFSMDEGAIEGPVKTEFGFHIIRLDQIIEPGALPLDQVRAELTIELQDQKAERQFRDLESKLSSALFDATDIRAIAADIGAEVQTVTGFTRSGGEPFAGSPAVIDAIFDEAVLSGAQISDIVEIDINRSAVFSVTKHNPATRQPLDDIREQVTASLRAQQAEDLMAAKADEMLAALANGTDFADAAAAVGAVAAEPVVMSRSGEGVDQFVMVSVFTAVKPTQENPTTGSTRNGVGGYTVFSLDAVIPGRPENPSAGAA